MGIGRNVLGEWGMFTGRKSICGLGGYFEWLVGVGGLFFFFRNIM